MMATKAKKPATPIQPKPRKHIPCRTKGDTADAHGEAFAQTLTASALAAHRVIQAANPQNLRDEIDVPGMLSVLRQQADAVKSGDLSQAEAMLVNQATALQSLFTHLTERGLTQTTMANLEGFMRLALKAQAQCRSTLETLSAIKNPPVIYAKQVNQTTGPQQINNGIAPQSQARSFEHEPVKLLDAREAGASVPSYPALEALGEKHRAEVARGQGEGRQEQRQG